MIQLETSRRKVALAKAQIAELKQESDVFWQTNQREVIVEADPEHSDEEIHKLKFTAPIPARFTDLTADAVHNLRSSLDSAVYSMAVATGKARPKYAAFPFVRSAAAFESHMKTRCKYIPEGLYYLFSAYQPYRGGDSALWELNEISLTDKPKLLRIGLVGHLGWGAGGDPAPIIIEAPWDRLKNEFKFDGYIAGDRSYV
jgi:hypothetical protein